MILTLRGEWLWPGFVPGDLYDSPFIELPCVPRFAHVMMLREPRTWRGTLDDFAGELIDTVAMTLSMIRGPIDVMVGGGYDSRILLVLLERLGLEARCVTDGEEEPECSQLLDYLAIPQERRYRHDLTRTDPYGLVGQSVPGYAPLYHMLDFAPPDRSGRTLVTGLGGGEWFSYPASGWHLGKQHRTDHRTLAAAWLDCWPQYTVLPDAWARGYAAAVHPFTTMPYARVADRCHPDWVRETPGRPELDWVRAAMLDYLDPKLKTIGWAPHRYDWRLTPSQCELIDTRYLDSQLAKDFHRPDWGLPSAMDRADHACKVAGLASWIELLEAEGHRVSW